MICECLCANLGCHGNPCFSFVFVYIYWCVLLISLAGGVATKIFGRPMLCDIMALGCRRMFLLNKYVNLSLLCYTPKKKMV